MLKGHKDGNTGPLLQVLKPNVQSWFSQQESVSKTHCQAFPGSCRHLHGWFYESGDSLTKNAKTGHKSKSVGVLSIFQYYGQRRNNVQFI